MSRQTSAATGNRYAIKTICRVWGIPRSTVYLSRAHEPTKPTRRRGPVGPFPDDVLVGHIGEVLSASPFQGEGYRKVWARLRFQGIRTSKERVRRLMREHGLRAPYFPTRKRGNKAHDGTITTSMPNQMWGMDATSTMTRFEGSATIFIAVDHCTSECIGIHAAKKGTRFEALEPVRQGVREQFGAFEEGCAAELVARHDHGSQYMSDDFQAELRFLGVDSSPSFVAEPECNGVSERFIRTLKEQILWIQSFDTVEELRVELHRFKERYNNNWLVQKHNYRTPVQARNHLLQPAVLAA